MTSYGSSCPATSVDVVVVGNGIVGTTIALGLVTGQPGLSVVLLGPYDRAAGASQAAGAMLGLFGEVTKYTLADVPGRAKFELGLRARELWPDHLDRLAVHASGAQLRVADDTYVVLNARSGELDSHNFAALQAALAEHDEPFDEVREVPGLKPVPDARPLRALRLPREGAVDAGQVLCATEQAARRGGVAVIDGHAHSLVRDGTSIVGVRTDRGETVSAGAVVLAAGAFTTALLDTVLEPGEVQPVLAGSGVAYTARRVLGAGFESVVRTVNRAGSCGLHVVPLGRGREYLGATNVIFREAETQPHLGVCHFVAACAMDQLDQNFCYSRVERTHIGNRPVPLDTYPLLGRVGPRGLHVVTGTYRDGFHLAPLLGRWAAQEVLTGHSVFPTLFAPDRDPLFSGTPQQSVDEYVMQAVSSLFEAGTSVSQFLDTDSLSAVYRPRAEAVYDALPVQSGLPVDVITFLSDTRKSPYDVSAVADYLLARATRARARSEGLGPVGSDSYGPAW